MKVTARWLGGVLIAVAFAWGPPCCGAGRDGTVLTPIEHQRGAEQTFLTFPEWFLVFSPAEYATYVKDHRPERFPFLAHIGQFWSSYGKVCEATKPYPLNFGYHVMILVIGVSTSVEYSIRAAYETLVGRLSGLSESQGLTQEDRFGAAVARDYVDFIRVWPWYLYDFKGKLAGLWRETDLWGPDPLRKWERKYALTTEYGIKAAYGWIIKRATHAAYDQPLQVTAAVVDRVPADLPGELSELKILQRLPDGSAVTLLPRYEAFTKYAVALAANGVEFREIAGNRAVILVSLIAKYGWDDREASASVLFSQPILTRPPLQRYVLIVPVASLSAQLRRIGGDGASVEHVFDY